MESPFWKDVRFDILNYFSIHLMDRHMIEETAQAVSSLVEGSARVNSTSRHGLTNFLRLSTQGSQSCYKHIEFNEVVTLVGDTIRYGMKCTNRLTGKEAIHSFNGHIRVFCIFMYPRSRTINNKEKSFDMRP